MRLSHPLLLASLGVLVAAASCTLITDVDRSKIPDGTAGMASGGDGTSHPQAGEMNNPTAGSPSGNGGAPEGGAGGTPSTTPVEGGAGGSPATETGGMSAGGMDNGTGGTPDAGAPALPNAGIGGIN